MSVTGTKVLLPEGLLAIFYSIYYPAVGKKISRSYIKRTKNYTYGRDGRFFYL